MKKIFTILSLCCATVLFMASCGSGSKSGSDSSSSDSSRASDVSSDVPCVTAQENTVILLTHAGKCEVENTDKGCLVTFKTQVGKQAFLIPYQYKLDYYNSYTANGSFEKLPFIPGSVFRQDTGFHMKGNVRPYEGKGMLFRLPNKKMLAFVAVYGYDEDAVEAATVKVRHLKMLLTSKEELPIINVNVTLALSPEQVILPIYPTADDSQLSTPVDIEDLVNDGKIKGCKLFHFD